MYLLIEALQMISTVNENITLELTAEKHAEALFEAVNNNREHLSRFLPWVPLMRSVSDLKTYLQNCEILYQQGKEVSFIIFFKGIAVGRIGLHHINSQNKTAAIGYWLASDAEGNGIITKSCIALIDYGFAQVGLHRIEIKAAAENVKSKAIPERLKFTKEGILREAELVNNKFLDLAIYSMLSNEWPNNKTSS